MTTPADSLLIEKWEIEERQPFFGWDFSYLNGRMHEDQPPWSYSSRAAELMRRSLSVLDMGTAAGERFRELQDHWPPKVAVTEEYPPNLALAKQNLEPLGVSVFDVRLTEQDGMPFRNEEFSIVLDRHAAFNSEEVARILSVGGTFLTQQVHGLCLQDLLAKFDALPQWPQCTPQRYIPFLEAAGLTIVEAREWSGTYSFTDVGAIVYYLKAVPWLVPGFSVATHSDHLLALQRGLEAGHALEFSDRRYIIEAIKPQPRR